MPSHTDTAGHSILFEFEWLFNATLTAEVISWRGRPDNVVAVGLDPKNSRPQAELLTTALLGLPAGHTKTFIYPVMNHWE